MPRTLLQSIKALVKDERKARLVLVDGSLLEGTVYLHDQQSNSIILCSARSKDIISDLRLIPVAAIKEVGPPDITSGLKASQKGSGKSTPKKSGSSTPDRRGSRGDTALAATTTTTTTTTASSNGAVELTVSIPKEVGSTKPLHKKSGSSTPVRRGSRADIQIGTIATRESSASSVASKELAANAKEPVTATASTKTNKKKSGTSTPARRGSRPDPPTLVNGTQDDNSKTQPSAPKEPIKSSTNIPKNAATSNTNVEQTQAPSLSEDGRLLLAGLSKHLQVRQDNQALIITAASTEIRLDPPYTKIEGTGDTIDKVRRILNSERQVMPKKEKGRRINVKVPVKGG